MRLFSRLITNRIAPLMPVLIHPSQCGFTRGRRTADVAQTLRSILAYAASSLSTCPVDAVLLLLDWVKAYDRIAHRYLRTALAAYGFSPATVQLLSFSFSKAKMSILDGGRILPSVNLGCGVRQGDPLAPLLFNLALDPFLLSLRINLRGIPMPWGNFITSAFADDTNAGLQEDDVGTFAEEVTDFEAASNSLLSLEKSLVVELSPRAAAWSGSLPYTIHPTDRPFTALGFNLALDPTGMRTDWSALLTKLVRTTHSLSQRNVSTQGRAYMVNYLLLSRLWYTCS